MAEDVQVTDTVADAAAEDIAASEMSPTLSLSADLMAEDTAKAAEAADTDTVVNSF